MKILSFDIGIRNLAFCMYYSENNGIEEWKVVDILSYGEDMTSSTIVVEMASKWKKDKFVEWFTANGLEIPKNKKEMLEVMKKHLKIENKGKKKEKVGIDMYTNKLLKWLDANKQLLNCDVVALENQPCMKNPIMKTIQTIIYTYFYYFGVLHGQVKEVRLVSATNKLKIKPEGYITPIETTENEKKLPKDKKKYADRKSLANEYMSFYLNRMENKELHLYWSSNSKKDDLSDCFLQAVYVSKNNK